MVLCRLIPKIPIGIVPTMTNQPMRASGSLRSAGSVNDRAQVTTILAMSFRK